MLSQTSVVSKRWAWLLQPELHANYQPYTNEDDDGFTIIDNFQSKKKQVVSGPKTAFSTLPETTKDRVNKVFKASLKANTNLNFSVSSAFNITPSDRKEAIGFKNFGNTCFLASLLQAFYANPTFEHEWTLRIHRNNHTKPMQETKCVFCMLQFVWDSLVSTKPDSYVGENTPRDIKDPLFFCFRYFATLLESLGTQQDASEVSDHLMNQLESASALWDENKLIQKMFASTYQILQHCSVCKTDSALRPTDEYSVYLSVDETLKHTDTILVSKCIDTYFGEEEVGLSNCYTCSKNYSSQKILPLNASLSKTNPSIVQTPRVKQVKLVHARTLVFAVKRLQYDKVTHQPVLAEARIQPELIIHMADFSINQSRLDYSLYAIVCHLGSSKSGHYVSYIKLGDKWWYCNDDKITLSNEKDVLNQRPYVFYYTAND